MDEVVRRSVLDRLDVLDAVAEQGPAEALLPVARDELFRLSEGLRVLLQEHRPDDDGRCRVCPGAWRRRRWPCSVWTTARRQLISQAPGEQGDDGPRHERADDETEPIPAVLGHVKPEDPEFPTAAPDPLPECGDEPATGGREPEHTGIHRAPVVERDIRWPPVLE